MRKPMDWESFADLLEYIEAKHRFTRGRHIRYVVPTIDMRTSDIHSIDFYGFEEKSFRITNENADRDLFAWVMEWLKDGEEAK